MPPYTGLDFYQIDELLSEEERMIRDTVRSFVSDEIIPIIEKHNREATFPSHLIPKMGELGLHGITVEEEYGGLGLGYLEHVVAQEEVARASASIGSSGASGGGGSGGIAET